jgi:hypothetical protein
LPRCAKPAFGVNGSGGQHLAGAAGERLEFISLAISRMGGSPSQVRVLPAFRARHTIIYPEPASPKALHGPGACAAFSDRIKRGIACGAVSIEAAHFRFCLTSMSAKGPMSGLAAVASRNEGKMRTAVRSGAAPVHRICATHKYALTISQIGHDIASGPGTWRFRCVTWTWPRRACRLSSYPVRVADTEC